MTGVYIATKTESTGTYSPAVLNTTYTWYTIAAGAEADAFIIEGYIDLRSMASGDAVTLTENINVDGNSLQPFQQNTYSGAQSIPVIRFFSKTIAKVGGYSLQINQTTGTLRSYDYAVILQVMSG